MGSCKDMPNMESDVSLDDENLVAGRITPRARI